MNYTNEELMMNEEAYLNDDCRNKPCDQEIYDIITDAIFDLDIGDECELELNEEDFQRVFKRNNFDGDDYYIKYELLGDEDVALIKYKKD